MHFKKCTFTLKVNALFLLMTLMKANSSSVINQVIVALYTTINTALQYFLDISRHTLKNLLV